MWGCSEPLRRPRLRCTISQTPGAHFHEVVYALAFRTDVFRMSLASRHGHWSKPRSGWRLEAKQLTTSQNLRITGNPSISLAMHSLPTLRPHQKHTFISPTATNFFTQIQGTRTRKVISYAG